MVDILLSVGLIGASALGGFVGGFLWRMLLDYGQVSELIRRVESLENSIKGKKSVEVRKDRDERINMALAEASLLMQEGKQLPDIAKELLPKYPDIAGKLATDLMQGRINL
jgi:hypothetical protein